MELVSNLMILPTATSSFVTTFLLVCLVTVAVAVAVQRNIVVIVVTVGVFSLLMAAIFTTLQAPDVALTEAVVGAGISSLLAMATCVVADINICYANRYSHTALFATLIVGSLLLYATLDMPAYGLADNPVHQRVVPYYLSYAYSDTGIKNVVTVILAGYRGYDTLGESIVVLIAGLGVLFLLGERKERDPLLRPESVNHVRVLTLILLPAIALVAFYVQFHGDTRPGGAFQAGVLFAVVVALYTLVVGHAQASALFTTKRVMRLASIGITIYVGVGIASMVAGGNFLEYGVLLADSKFAQHLAIFLVEIGIACNVAAILSVIFIAIVAYPPFVRKKLGSGIHKKTSL